MGSLGLNDRAGDEGSGFGHVTLKDGGIKWVTGRFTLDIRKI